MSIVATRQVSCEVDYEVSTPTVLALQIAVARSAGPLVEERLAVTIDGEPLGAIPELVGEHGGRVHILRARPGPMRVEYSAGVGSPRLPDAARAEVDSSGHAVYDIDAVTALRQSRYCPSDALAGFAAVEFADHVRDDIPHEEQAHHIAEWVHHRLGYVPGTSDSLDTALDTLVRHEGVCRDFAHLTVALCRAIGLPARLVSAYAPGLSPMDFHAVAEVRADGAWQILDATRLAPRPALVRIATGRDAADVAFGSILEGRVELVGIEVWATTTGDLPTDDHTGPVVIG